MKKVVAILIPTFVLVIIGAVILFTQFIKPINLEFASNVTINYSYGDRNIHVDITDTNDIASLKSVCKGTAINDFSVPSCGFGTVELIFEGNGRKVMLYPACDSCSTMRFLNDDKFFYDIGDLNREKLVKILEKYGVTFPCE